MRKVVGSLEDTLTALAEYLDSSAYEYIHAAYQDEITGWDFGNGDWPCGSLHTPEGQTLYAIVRREGGLVIECGSLYGCSSAHIATAIEDSNSEAYDPERHLTSIDILEGAGNLFPSDLENIRTQLYMDGAAYLNTLPDNSVDMVYEDTDHTYEATRDIWLAAIPKVRSGGVIVSHDSEHATVGETVTKAVIEALGHDDVLTLLVPPADCGLLVWRKP